MNPRDKLIVALDVDSEEKAINITERLKNDVKFFKVGLELFSSCGPSIIKRIREMDCEVFLDMKFHDIPNTVIKAAIAVIKMDIFMFNIHGLGGYDMMKETAEIIRAEAKRLNIRQPKILAVTILTSMDEKALKKVGIKDDIDEEVLRLAKLAKDAGLDGVVASSKEIGLIRKYLGKDFLIVTPGIRPPFTSNGDQKRTATPKEAIKSGTDYIVVGRPIIEARDPVEAAQGILREMAQ